MRPVTQLTASMRKLAGGNWLDNLQNRTVKPVNAPHGLDCSNS